MSHSPIINLQQIYSDIESELDDVYSDGIISAAIYNKKAVKRFMLHAINQADQHICLRLKLKSYVFIYVPSGQKVVFFDRQSEYVSDQLDEYSSVLTEDGSQYAHLIGNNSYLNVVSCDSSIAIAFSKIPIDESDTGIALWNSEAQDVFSNIEDYQYQATSGTLYTVTKSGHRFFVDGNQRKLVLDQSFSEEKWILLNAQIAPIRLDITEISKGDLDEYEILCPYYAQRWLVNRAMTQILPNRAASEGGYFDLEKKSEAEAIANQPSEGNVIHPGDEMGGNYESQFDFN